MHFHLGSQISSIRSVKNALREGGRTYVELAKLAEHRLGDHPRAYVLTDEALTLARRGLVRPGPDGGELSIEALEHRLARLRGKLEKHR